MAMIFAILVTLANPLGLTWEHKAEDRPEVQDFKHFYGDLDWGKIFYLGTSEIVELETELVLEYSSNNMLSRAMLILTGLNEANCIVKYKEVNKLLTAKYGPIYRISSVKDPLLNDMIYYRECYALKSGMQQHEITWHWEDFEIKSVLFGDEEGIYIEIEYTKKSLKDRLTGEQLKKIIKRL